MSYDLATAKTRLGITGTAQDAMIQSTLDGSVAIAERYCDRRLAYASETVKFYHFEGDTMFLPRYPIEQVVSSTGLPAEVKIHHRLGTLEFHSPTFIEEAEISYAGGYQVYPLDLELALWGIFDTVWPAVNGGATVAAGAIDSITIPDVGTVRYNNSSSSGTGNANVLGPYSGILDTYRRLTC